MSSAVADPIDRPGLELARELAATGTWPDAVEQLDDLLYADGSVVHAEAALALARLAVRCGHRHEPHVFDLIALVATGGTTERLRRGHTPESLREMCAGGARALGILGTEAARSLLRVLARRGL